ncbi:MAG: hypothetical protein HY874_10795 [Chloroflexi bacterium]|nr:hypothetical protein [Chloroflexota bacterium]
MFDMFGDNVATPLPSLELDEVEVSKAEMLSWEKELLGVYISEHPFTSAAVTISKHTSALVSEITAEMDGRDVVIAGMVNTIRSLATKAGKMFIAVSVEDLSGSTEVTVWSDVYEPTRDLWSAGNILLMLVRVRERGDRLQASVQQVSLVQAADGSVSHERFQVPGWLTEAVRSTAGVSVAAVRHENGAVESANGKRENGTSTAPGDAPPSSGIEPQPEAPAPPNGTPKTTLRFFLHESADADADRARLDALIALISSHPGDDAVRLFIHAHDGDRIELTMPDARACEELRAAGIELLGTSGGAEPLTAPQRTHGVQPLEV